MKEYKNGVYDISNEEYHSSPGISRTGIMELKRSPLHYWHRYLNPHRCLEKWSPSKFFGNAFHTAILEPDSFFERYCIMPKVDKRTTKGKAEYAAFCAKNIGKTVLTEEDYIQINKMSSSIKNSNTAEELILGGKFEKSIYWIDKDTGVLCKARPDIWHSNMIVDLKTAADASFHAFQRDLYKYGYYIQAAMIREGIKEVYGQDMTNFIFLPIEKEEPHVPAIYPLDETALDRGHEEFKKQLYVYRECLQKNEWPGYPIERVSLPPYAA
jgi:exodeoxyribonuclease VIII